MASIASLAAAPSTTGEEILGLDGILASLVAEVNRLKKVEAAYHLLLDEHQALKASYESLANGSPAAQDDMVAAAGTAAHVGATKWIKCYSPTDKSFYYYNTRTSTTQWEEPEGCDQVEEDQYSSELAAADMQAEYDAQQLTASEEDTLPAATSEEEHGDAYRYADSSSTNPYPMNPIFLSSMSEPSAPTAPLLVEASALPAIDALPLYLDSGVATATAVLIDEVLEESGSRVADNRLLQRRRRGDGSSLSIRSELNDDDDDDDDEEGVPGLVDTDTVPADPRFLTRLLDMGFEEAAARRALAASSNNISVAVADLVQGMSRAAPGSSRSATSSNPPESSPAASSSRRLLLSNGLSSIQSTSRRLFGRPKTAPPPADPPANPYPRSTPAMGSRSLNVYPTLRR